VSDKTKGSGRMHDLQALELQREKMLLQLAKLNDDRRELKKAIKTTETAIFENVRDLDKPPQPDLFDEGGAA